MARIMKSVKSPSTGLTLLAVSFGYDESEDEVIDLVGDEMVAVEAAADEFTIKTNKYVELVSVIPYVWSETELLQAVIASQDNKSVTINVNKLDASVSTSISGTISNTVNAVTPLDLDAPEITVDSTPNLTASSTGSLSYTSNDDDYKANIILVMKNSMVK